MDRSSCKVVVPQSNRSHVTSPSVSSPPSPSWSTNKLWHRLVMQTPYKTTAACGMLSAPLCVMVISVFLYAVSWYSTMHMELPIALYTALWSAMGGMAAFVWTCTPSRRTYFHSVLTQLSFWSYIMALVQMFSAVLHTVQGVYFLYSVPGLARQCAFLRLYLCFCIGLPIPKSFLTWSTASFGFVMFGVAVVVCMTVLVYTAEVYRGFFRLVVDEGRPTNSPLSETLIASGSGCSTEGDDDLPDPEKSPTGKELQRQQYNSCLAAYYAQFGELGAMAEPYSIPVEEFIKTKVAKHEQDKWWAVLKSFQV